MTIKEIIDGLQRGDCQTHRQARKETIRILAEIDNIKADIKAKAKLLEGSGDKWLNGYFGGMYDALETIERHISGYERLDELVENGEMTEEEARQEYREYKEAQAEEYMNECLYGEQF